MTEFIAVFLSEMNVEAVARLYHEISFHIIILVSSHHAELYIFENKSILKRKKEEIVEVFMGEKMYVLVL
jgi:hypothetical protein